MWRSFVCDHWGLLNLQSVLLRLKSVLLKFLIKYFMFVDCTTSSMTFSAFSTSSVRISLLLCHNENVARVSATLTRLMNFFHRLRWSVSGSSVCSFLNSESFKERTLNSTAQARSLMFSWNENDCLLNVRWLNLLKLRWEAHLSCQTRKHSWFFRLFTEIDFINVTHWENEAVT